MANSQREEERVGFYFWKRPLFFNHLLKHGHFVDQLRTSGTGTGREKEQLLMKEKKRDCASEARFS